MVIPGEDSRSSVSGAEPWCGVEGASVGGGDGLQAASYSSWYVSDRYRDGPTRILPCCWTSRMPRFPAKRHSGRLCPPVFFIEPSQLSTACTNHHIRISQFLNIVISLCGSE